MDKLRRIFLLVLLLLVLIAGLCLGLYNGQLVTFDYLAGQVELPLIVLMTVSAVFTLLVAALLAVVPVTRDRRRIARLQKENDRLRQQQTTAANLPANRG